jgi:hypothetical protein
MQGLIAAILIIGGAGAYAAIGVIVTRKLIRHQIAEGHNDVLVPLFLTAGVIYAVLVGFLVVAVWESYDAAHANIADEATTLVPLYRLTNGMQPEHGAAMRELIREYAEQVVRDEWPTLATAHPGSSKARKAIGDMDRSFAAMTPEVKAADAQINAEFLRTISVIVAERNKRLMQAGEELPWIMWLGAVGGGVIVIAMSFILYMDRRWPHVAMATVMAALIGTLLFMVLLLSRPFAGPMALDSAPFESTLKVFNDIDRGN